MQLLTLLALVVPAVAFVAAPGKPSSMALAAEKSKSLPFLDRPAKLDGSLIGDVGFDPLGLTEILPNLNYVREAEIKHGRVAMLGAFGFVFQQFHHPLLPEISDPLKAVPALGLGPQLQVLFAIGAIELATWDGTFSGSRTPGDFKFDPLNQLKGKSAAQINDLKLKELKNGRLAMIASIGMVVENLLFDGRPTLSF